LNGNPVIFMEGGTHALLLVADVPALGFPPRPETPVQYMGQVGAKY